MRVKHAQSFLKKLRMGEQFVAFLSFSVMALALIFDVLMREASGAGFFGSAQVGVFGMVVASFIGIGLATADGAHLRPRFADNLFPSEWGGVISRVGDVLTAAFYFFVAVVAVAVVRDSFELGDVTSTLRVVIWPFQTAIVIAFFIGGVRHVLYVFFPELKPHEGGVTSSEGGKIAKSAALDSEGGR